MEVLNGLVTSLREALAWRLRRLRARLQLRRATIHRGRLKHTKFIGVTGSVGKTTTKDLALAVLNEQGTAVGNHLSLNYLVDMARMIPSIRGNTDYAVLEVATAGPGTIDARVEMCRPDIAAITIIGRDHIKQFGSKEAIAEEKAKLIAALPADGTAVLNRDDPFIREVADRTTAKRLWFGEAEDADLRLLAVSSDYQEPLTLTVAYEGREYICPTQLHGTHLAVSAMAALGIGLAAGLPIEVAIRGLAKAVPSEGRMQVVDGGDGVTFLRDDYKAPHWTLETNYEFLRDAKASRKVAVIGTLSDYSLSASKVYPKVARRFLEVADLVVFVGPHALRALKAKQGPSDESLRGFTRIEDANVFLRSELRAGDLVLLKGTNRVDHLVRLLLTRQRNVSCWEAKCGLNRFCYRCEFVDRGDTVPTMCDAPEGEHSAANEDRATSDAWLVVGLQNSGPEYANTPHNIGAVVLDKIVANKGQRWEETPEGKLSRHTISGTTVYFLKPSTLINNCGDAVAGACQRLAISYSQVIAIHDDVDLPLAEVRRKDSGSDGGQKGLRSLISTLGNDGFMSRVRVGVNTGSEFTQNNAADDVLASFSPEQQDRVSQAIDNASRRLEELFDEKLCWRVTESEH